MAFYAGVSYGIGRFDRWAGVALIGLFLIYMSTVLWTERKRSKNGVSESHAEEEKPAKPRPLWLEMGMLVVGAALIAVGARLLVDKGTVIAKLLGVPESVIALTFVALGTSLPELVTAITSLAKGHSALSLGNIVGANLFNLVLVSGISTTLRPYDIPAGKLVFGHSSSLVMDIPLCFILMALLTVPALISKKVMRWQGILLLAVYAAYVTFQFFI